jgi:hypothetical protein
MKYSFATFVFVLLLSCFAMLQVLYGQVAAANQLSAPRVGVVRYADGGVYLLYGLPGSYVIGPRVLDGADSASFSERGGLVARKGSLALLRSDFSLVGTFETGESNPLLGMDDDLTKAIAWLPSTKRLVHWDGQAFAAVSVPDLSREGNIGFVSKRDNRTALLLLHSSDGFASEASVSLETGQVTSVTVIAGAHGHSFRHGPFVLFPENHDLVITTPANGNTKRFPLAADDLSVERVSSDCLHLSSSATRRDWLLHFHNGDFDLAELPPPSVEVAK